MKLNPNKLGLAGALTMALAYIVSAVVMYIWPMSAARMMAALMFLTSPAPFMAYFEVTVYNTVSSIIQSGIYTYLFLYIMATIYNKITD